MALAFPSRNTRQADPDYDEDQDKMDVEYYDELSTDEPEIEISTLSPDEDYSPAHVASLEEEEEEPEEELENEREDKNELPITPSLIPSGSGGVSMGPDTSGGLYYPNQPKEEPRRMPSEILHISGDILGSGHMLSSGSFEASADSGISGKIPDAGEYHSGEPMASRGSGGSGGFISGGFADVSSGYISSESFASGNFEDLVSGTDSDFVSGVTSGFVSENNVSVDSGDFVSGESGDIVSGTSGGFVSGVPEDIVSGTSGDFVSGESGNIVSLVPVDLVSTESGGFVSGESGGFVSGESGGFVSGESGGFVSGESGGFVSGESGGFVSGESGGFVSGVSDVLVSGDNKEFVSGVSGHSGNSLEVISGYSGEHSGVSGDSGSGPPVVTLVPGGEEEIHITVTSQPEEFSGIPEETGPPEESGFFERVTITPTLKEEEELFSTTQTPPQEVTGSATGSGQPESPDPDVEVIEIDTKGMSTCLLCICLGGSVYCDDVKLVNVPPLPKDTTHFYARYNKITKINKSDFANLNKLKRIDLTSNTIWKIEDGALYGLPALEELVIRENSLAQLPALPASMTLVDASHNHLGRTSIQNEAFKDMTGLLYLYLTDNKIDHVPVPLPETLRSLHLQNNNIQMIHEDTFCKQKDMHYRRNGLEDIRLDGNPVILSRTPQAYVCLPRIPIGALV
ncbi:epiphycan [Tachysurus fulvidraco]|uniref:epiphycan n=1 Tax=Tachysurus fulvidraco TaxID=1234273 RepID=UPI001FEE4253|nr:epiphycan [Tachysurus fulvidraco]